MLCSLAVLVRGLSLFLSTFLQQLVENIGAACAPQEGRHYKRYDTCLRTLLQVAPLGFAQHGLRVCSLLNESEKYWMIIGTTQLS